MTAIQEARQRPQLTCAEVGRAIRRCTLFVLLLAVPSFSQTMDQFSGAVVFLYRTEQSPTIKDGKETMETVERGGTGFLVTPDNSTMILVTAEHVSKDLKDEFRAIVRGDNDTPVDMSSEDLAGTKSVSWITHGTEDVAVTILHPNKDTVAKLAGHFMPKNLISSDSSAPSRDRPLTTLGFPLALGSVGHFSPITRESKPSSGLITLPRFDTKKPATFFLLSDPSIAGFSGAPLLLTSAPYALPTGAMVFPETGGAAGTPIRCVGIVHGTINDKTGGGMAAVTPSIYILETIDKAMKQ
jgi:hypothetical protein